MKTPSVATRILSFGILILVAIVASWALKLAVHIVMWLIGAIIVLAVVLFVASKLRRAGRL